MNFLSVTVDVRRNWATSLSDMADARLEPGRGLGCRAVGVVFSLVR